MLLFNETQQFAQFELLYINVCFVNKFCII